MEAPFGAWGTQTFIAGLSAGSMIAPWVIKGAMDGPAFAAYVEKVLVPELAPGTVVILDNLATHKNATAAKAMRDAGCWFLFRCSGKTPHWGLFRSLQPLQPRSESDRDGLLEAQSSPSQDRRAVIYRHVQRSGRNL